MTGDYAIKTAKVSKQTARHEEEKNQEFNAVIAPRKEAASMEGGFIM